MTTYVFLFAASSYVENYKYVPSYDKVVIRLSSVPLIFSTDESVYAIDHAQFGVRVNVGNDRVNGPLGSSNSHY